MTEPMTSDQHAHRAGAHVGSMINTYIGVGLYLWHGWWAVFAWAALSACFAIWHFGRAVGAASE